MTFESSAEAPAPVRVVSTMLHAWIGKLGSIWIEGQVAEFRPRPGARAQFFTLRDVDTETSLKIVTTESMLANLDTPLEPGQRCVVFAKPEFWTGQGSLQLRATEIRHVGVGDLLAQLERLKNVLAAEGLFAPERKKALPFLPRKIGLICGRNSAAMKDVIVNAQDRWPSVEFEVREVAVQGTQAVSDVVNALTELDGIPDVDVIIITRGGGSVEDLLPFSNEAMVRAVAGTLTPVISAIGHEQDAPLVDFVADLRASTPTDAAKRVVPSFDEQSERVATMRKRLDTVLDARLADATERVDHARDRLARAVTSRVEHGTAIISGLHAQLRALSPQSTLDRGYAIVQRSDRQIVRSPQDAQKGTSLRITVAEGSFNATSDGE